MASILILPGRKQSNFETVLIPSPLLREVDFFLSVSHLLQQVFTLRKSQTLMTESTKRWQTNKRECSTHAKGMPRKTTICSFCQIESQCKEVINITRTELRQEAPTLLCPWLQGPTKLPPAAKTVDCQAAISLVPSAPATSSTQ